MGAMGGCLGSQDTRASNIKLANKIFASIDTKDTGKIDQDNLSAYFKQYSDSSVKIILKEMDFNNDGIITHGEWIGYWEYVRLAGYNDKAITKSLKQMQEGVVFLNFTRASSYQSGVPRQTLINGIIKQLKEDNSFPIRLEP